MTDAHFPGSQVLDAATRVISNLLPPRAYLFLFALLPGLFFETSILLANPALVYLLTARATPFIGPSHYAPLGLVLFLAFVIGNAFIFLVLFIQTLLGYLYWLRDIVWVRFCTWALHPLTTWLQRKPWWARRRSLRSVAMYVERVRFQYIGADLDRDTRQCWALLARRLLKDQFGIEPADVGQDEWNVLYQTIGPLTLADLRGDFTMTVFEATGWCGLAAMLFAPALRNRYYVTLLMLLIASGLMHDWHVEGRLANPRWLGFLKIRALLREYGHPKHEDP